MRQERVNEAGYPPIAEHGLIGDLHTAALVCTNGTIDWYCCPRFDAPSLFGSILDKDRGGHYRIAPSSEGWTSKQLYIPDTNVLITRFLSPDGVGEVQDFMPITGDPGAPGRRPHRLVRRVTCVRGRMPFRLELEPRFDYGRERHETRLVAGGGATFETPTLTVALGSPLPLERTEAGVQTHFVLGAGEGVAFVLDTANDGEEPRAYGEAETLRAFEDTVAYWRRWLSRSRYEGRWRETVHRSALTLKLLTYAPTGAIVAAPTTSLPEQLGGGRNWDYRYTWIRDAAFSLYGLLRLGFTEEAGAFMGWLTERFREDRRDGSPLQLMYGIDGRAELPETTLDHLEGYAGSAPVRIGNGAADQLQLDIYGELVDSVYLYNKYGTPVYHDAWEDLSRIVEWVCENWDRADEGIWETRGGRKDFTYSRLMCWVAVERAVRIARQRGLPADVPRWSATRDAIYRQIMSKGWHEGRGAFVQHYDTEVLDASVLMMPLVKFIAPTDPRWLSTLDAISSELVADSLVYRYNPGASPDGLIGDEGTFSICSFWYVEALTRAGRLDEARLAFEKMLSYANHLGLYSEEVGPSGELLGNFPQAFTHLSLISAAFNLDRALSGGT
ncbi:MAG: Glucoamylase [uncultured Rubrobacteraceae bacterium]|uniref:Glucoamylase n=1 Tax=uncultured Rubrobacteraceae bacterium TaxID=349277 RepID=A0A6J4PVR1_9ACTN|nr:MAG: Glucoamylase [uncultured Rubrobacteraceae bacterium]